ncbi:MAG TPA: hypothetical protein VFZ96_08620, partial [Actinomycetota bacterium]|nr:hypothetical protein [Actinomycetota bacterium]
MDTIDSTVADTTPARGPSKGRKHAPRTNRKRRPGIKGFFRKWWWAFVAVPLVGVLGVLATLYYLYTQLELPSTPPPLQTTYVYDRDGKLLTTLHAGVDRTIVPIDQIPT